MTLSDLTAKSPEDHAALDRLHDAAPAMLERTIDWSRANTGSYNADGLKAFAPTVADAFAALDAEVALEPGEPFELVGAKGTLEEIDTGPVITVTARPDAPMQVVMSGHYDTVFPPGTFTEVKDLGGGRWNGPGLADMKGGLVVMREALLALEAGPFKDRLGYRIVITPDEEVGNFASAGHLTRAAQSGALVGMTYEPCLETGDLAGARKGSAIFDAVFHGRSAHAGRAKEEGRSALHAAALFTAALEDLNGQRDGVSVNVGTIDGGNAVNIVPDLAIVRLGARAPDAQAAAWATDQINALFATFSGRDGIHGHIHGGFYRPPKPRNAAQETLFKAIHGTGGALGLDIGFVDTGGVCEGNNIFAAGVPNIDTLGVRGGRIHSDEEFLEADSFAERAALSAFLLNRFCDGRIDARAIKELMPR